GMLDLEHVGGLVITELRPIEWLAEEPAPLEVLFEDFRVMRGDERHGRLDVAEAKLNAVVGKATRQPLRPVDAPKEPRRLGLRRSIGPRDGQVLLVGDSFCAQRTRLYRARV